MDVSAAKAIVNPVTDEVIVGESQMITPEIARKIEQIGLGEVAGSLAHDLRCTSLGVCRRCYGMDMSTGAMVEEGMAVGIIAAQSIGEPGTQLTMRTFHIGGSVSKTSLESDIKSKKSGEVRLTRIRAVANSEGRQVVLTRNGEIALVDDRGREFESYPIPTGSMLMVEEGQQVKKGEILVQWNPYSVPILSEVSGKVRFEDVVEGETVRSEKEASGKTRMAVVEHKGDLHPQIVVEDNTGKALNVQFLPEKATISVTDGQDIVPGTVLAEMPRDSGGVSDITGGLPRVTEIFEARKPKDPAIIAEVDGEVEILPEKKRGKTTVVVRSESGIEREHMIPTGKHFLVHTGDIVKAGQSIVEGPLVPHDILRVSGEEAVQQYLLHEIQQVYQSQKVEINDKHCEIIIARMLRKVKVESAGDTNLLPGLVIDRFQFRHANQELTKCIRISHPGDSDYTEDTIIPKELFEETNAQIEAGGGTPAKGKKPKKATASTQLLGITKAAVQSNSFISAASFQETTKVLTEAALAGKIDKLVGLKENVILGHLIPAGTGFRMFQESEVNYRREALEELASGPVQSLEDSFPLLEAGDEALGSGAPVDAGNDAGTVAPAPTPTPDAINDQTLGEMLSGQPPVADVDDGSSLAGDSEGEPMFGGE